MRSRQAANAVRFVQVGFGDGGESDDGVHRGADVVGHVGEELRFRRAGGLREGERLLQVGLEAAFPHAVAVHERDVPRQRHGYSCHEHHRPAYRLPPPFFHDAIELLHRLGRLVQDAGVYAQKLFDGGVDDPVHIGLDLLVSYIGVAAQGDVFPLRDVERFVALLKLAGGFGVGLVCRCHKGQLLAQIGVSYGVGAFDVVDGAVRAREQRPVCKGPALHEQRFHASCCHGHGVGAVLCPVRFGAEGHHVVYGDREEQRHKSG